MEHVLVSQKEHPMRSHFTLRSLYSGRKLYGDESTLYVFENGVVAMPMVDEFNCIQGARSVILRFSTSLSMRDPIVLPYSFLTTCNAKNIQNIPQKII